MNSNQEKLVSVIIPAYNIEKYVSRAIESVIRQTYTNIEIIIVNDGSTDATELILREYSQKDQRIVLVNQTNKGVSAARNAGFRSAQGDYFCILDADDIMLPEKIESQVNFLEQYSADFIYSNVYYFFDGTYDIYRHDLATTSGEMVYRDLLKHGNFIYTSTIFFRRNVFDCYGGFDETLRSAEEFDYWLTLSSQGVMFLHQDDYLVLCRSRGDGLSSDSTLLYSSAVAVLEKHISRSKNIVLAKITSYQYLKSKCLQYISQLRKPNLKNEYQVTTTKGKKSSFLGYGVNKLFIFFRKIKFSLTFKKVYNQKIKEYLISVETSQSL